MTLDRFCLLRAKELEKRIPRVVFWWGWKAGLLGPVLLALVIRSRVSEMGYLPWCFGPLQVEEMVWLNRHSLQMQSGC